MHSRIFIIKSKESIENTGFSGYHDEEDFLNILSGVDYVIKNDLEAFKDSVEWLNSIYDISTPLEKIKVESEKRVVALITLEAQEKMLKKIREMKKKRIEKAKEMLSNPIDKIDTYMVSEIIYPRYSFWFEVNNNLMLDTDLLNKVSGFSDLKNLYITETFDYHF